ncbi:hypothetical protein HHK36_011621 [Tetracentron sinense]|uniref:SUN domain-containing protein n=1 Tax=Tetracentron sinense TaxID=13715 RepID=A0A835DK16_TETSI|nr:hypothetical protein HHK36_011621 [Tetracentron sinense]
MSASTVAITAKPAVSNSTSLALGSKPNARRRSVVVAEKKSSVEIVGEGGISEVGGDGKVGNGMDLSHSIRGEVVLERPKDLLQAKKNLVYPTVSPRHSRKVNSKLKKSRWQTVLSVFTKNFLLLLLILWLVQMFWKYNLKSWDSGFSPIGISDFEGRIAEVEAFLKKTTKMIQVQVDVVDRKIESEIGGLRRELTDKVEEKGVLFENELKKLDVKTDSLDKSLGELKSAGFFAKEDFDRFLDEFKNSRSLEDNNREWSLDEIRAFAREIVDKEIARHAADGLGRVDYALASGGAMIFRHSEPYISGKGSWFALTKGRNGVHSDAQKMLQPSFGEPGQCFPLKGRNGFVEIKLRTTIIPEAITLEHVAKSVAYDRSSAPKDCRVSAWLERRDADPSTKVEKRFLLVEFTYDLEKSNAQTFNVETDLGLVNMVRLDFISNHGSPSHTCIYRLRVHGDEPDSVAMLAMQS